MWASFYKGESAVAVEELILKLADNSGARSRTSKIQEQLDKLERFWRQEILKLARARVATACREWPVPQGRRDLIFLSYREGEFDQRRSKTRLD